jgi:hypothetical protein
MRYFTIKPPDKEELITIEADFGNPLHSAIVFGKSIPKLGGTKNYFSSFFSDEPKGKVFTLTSERAKQSLDTWDIDGKTALTLVNVSKKEYVRGYLLPTLLPQAFEDLGWEKKDRLIAIEKRKEQVLERFKNDLTDRTEELLMRRVLKRGLITNDKTEIEKEFNRWLSLLTEKHKRNPNEYSEEILEAVRKTKEKAKKMLRFAIYGGLIPNPEADRKEFEKYLKLFKEVLNTKDIAKAFPKDREEVIFRWKVLGRDGRERNLAEIFIKAPKGVYHAVLETTGMETDKELISQVRDTGHLSPRPYKPGQACDGSIDACVKALVVDFANRTGLGIETVNEIHKKAYGTPFFTDKLDVDSSVAFAKWQGVAYPQKWTEKEFKKLIQSLIEINNHDFATLLEEEVAKRRLFETKKVQLQTQTREDEMSSEYETKIIVSDKLYKEYLEAQSNKRKLNNWLRKVVQEVVRDTVRESELEDDIKEELAKGIKVKIRKGYMEFEIPTEPIEEYLKRKNLQGWEDISVREFVFKTDNAKELKNLLAKLDNIHYSFRNMSYYDEIFDKTVSYKAFVTNGKEETELNTNLGYNGYKFTKENFLSLKLGEILGEKRKSKLSR